GDDPIFAAVAEREIYICKPVGKSATSKTNNLEVLTILEDPDEDSSLNSVAWSVDIDTGEPLVCVAGSGSKNIKIFNVVTGELVRVLYGHGGAINDLVTSPVSPQILASCSGDYTIRIWNLDARYRRQPCAAILSGEGHRQTILSIVVVKWWAGYDDLLVEPPNRARRERRHRQTDSSRLSPFC
ncbi:WD40 repeat-like protein, partial [Aureobasidium melanogenum]